MENILNGLGNAATVVCALSCACVVGLFLFGGLLVRWAGVSLVPLVGDLIVGRVDRTPEKRNYQPATRLTGGTALKAQAQSLDFDDALRRQGAPPTIQGQSAAYPAQAQAAFPQQGYANTGFAAQSASYAPLQPSLQSIPPAAPPQMPTAGTIQPLYDNRVLPSQPMQAQAAPNQYPAATPYVPLSGPATPSLSAQSAPAYPSLSGGYPQGTPSLPQSADPNSFFPPPSGGIPRRASLSAPRDVSVDTSAQAGFNTENYPGLRNRGGRRRTEGQSNVDDQDGGGNNRNTLDGVIGNLGNFLGL